MSDHYYPSPLGAWLPSSSTNTSTDSSSNPGGEPAGSPGSDSRHNDRKRTQIETACSACRKRKSRCDGNRPNCSRCTTLFTACEYEAEAGESRWSALRRRNAVLEQERNDGDIERAEIRNLMAWLMTCPEPEARQLYDQIRSLGTDYMALFPLICRLKAQFDTHHQPPSSLQNNDNKEVPQLPSIRHFFDHHPILHSPATNATIPDSLSSSSPRDTNRQSSGSSYQDISYLCNP